MANSWCDSQTQTVFSTQMNHLEPARRVTGTKTPTQWFNEQKAHSVERGNPCHAWSTGKIQEVCVTWLGSNPIVLTGRPLKFGFWEERLSFTQMVFGKMRLVESVCVCKSVNALRRWNVILIGTAHWGIHNSCGCCWINVYIYGSLA